jgi:aminoglycoside phosphotransferase (APT) family kinase protein
MPNPPPASARSALASALAAGRPRSRSQRAEPVAWGDSGMTLRWENDGEAVAARWHEGRKGQARALGLAARSTWFADAGIPTPAPTRVIHVDDPIGAWTVSPWCDGTSGASLVGDLVEGPGLAATMGALSARISTLASVDALSGHGRSAALSLDRTWASPSNLTATATRWVGVVRDTLDPQTRRILTASIDVTSSGSQWGATVVHGDLVPINVIVTPDREMVVIDLEHMAVGPPSLDPAWWSWVVRFHHPDAWLATWPTFLAATGLTGPDAGDETLTAIGRIRALQRTIEAPRGSARALWLERLAATAGW